VSHALPQPLSPFHWLILVEHGEGYHLAQVNLARDAHGPRREASGFFARLAAGYAPAAEAVWAPHTRFGEQPAEMTLARAAFDHEALAPFRRFARFLVLDHVEPRGTGSCVWFSDLRFSLPKLPPSFRYGLCRTSSQAEWQLSRLHGAFGID
jgi:inner membrane protein